MYTAQTTTSNDPPADMLSSRALKSPPGLPLRSVCALFSLAAAFILFRFPPGDYPFYPVCPIHEYLHILCPGCGATRAFAALLHGHLTAALHLNAFAVLVLLPLAAIYAAICFNRSLRQQPPAWPAIPRPAAIALAILAVAFTLFRNQ